MNETTPTAVPVGLSPWEKLAIMSMGASVVGFTLLIVICFLGRRCWTRGFFKRRDSHKQMDSMKWPLYGTNGYKNNNNPDDGYSWEENKRNDNNSCCVWLRSSKEGSPPSPSNSEFPLHPTESAREQSSISSISSGESCASNISGSTMSIKSAFSSLSFKNRFRHNSLGEESTTSNSSTVEKGELSAVNVGLYWRIPSSGETCGKLAVSIMSCTDLPRREYGGAVDCYVQLSVVKERGRSLRRRNTPLPLSDWKTKIVRRSFNPIFDQTFNIDIPEVDFKNIQIKLSAFDSDRNTKTSEIGQTHILLRDIKLLTNNTMDQKISTTSYFARKKEEFGELLFGMSYLPTAQRMSFSIVKAANMKFEAVAPSLDVFFPYVRILHLGSNHKVIKKKKTSVKMGKRDPNFNETLNFEVPPAHLESSTFVILLNQKVNTIEMREVDKSPENSFESMQKDEQGSRDVCLGMICIGRRVRGRKERAHWMNVVQNPRKVFSSWQTFH